MTEVGGVLQNKFADNVVFTTVDNVVNWAREVEPLAHDLRPRLLRHRDDGDGRHPLRLEPLRPHPPRHARARAT